MDEPYCPKATKALFDAIYDGSREKVMDALYEGANVNACETTLSGYTPLTLALEVGGHPDEIVQQLCTHGADIHLANAWGATPLVSALAVKQTSWAKDFLARGAAVNTRGIVDDRLTSPLHEAAYWGLLDMIGWLMQCGADGSMYAHKHMKAQAYARTNPVNGPIELTRIERAIAGSAAHPIMSLWRHPVNTQYMKWNALESMERNPENWTYRWTTAMKNKDWYNALLAIEMGAFVDKEIADMVREKRYVDA